MDKENLKLIHTIIPSVILSVFITSGQICYQNGNCLTLKWAAVLAFLSMLSILTSFIPAASSQRWKLGTEKTKDDTENLNKTEKEKEDKKLKAELERGQCFAYQRFYHNINIGMVIFSVVFIILSALLFVIGVFYA